ncbi:CAP domain-containing protein [Lactobacillus xujianguonis]|nr:CAP domain-containing protein [Lactobacillus xujianguonis]
MKLNQKLFLLTAISVLTFIMRLSTQPVCAAKYSKSEATQVRSFQKQYHKLSLIVYSKDNLYQTPPNFSRPFHPGLLEVHYISTSMAFINYYRQLCGLPTENNFAKDNFDAQLGAASLAAVNAAINLKAHGLLGYRRPIYISKTDWYTAESATLGNINFLDTNFSATAGQIVTDLLQDTNNLAGPTNTGHRALLLSAKATHMGIGAAYGKDNNILYSVENGVFADDILRQPAKKIVTFPSKTVFPYELLTNKTRWSAYFAYSQFTTVPKIYITDLTTNKRYRAQDVQNSLTCFYSDGYATSLSFTPGKTKLINTHKYQVKIGNWYSYSFRLFREKSVLTKKQISK